jgi:hypothetical protein
LPGFGSDPVPDGMGVEVGVRTGGLLPGKSPGLIGPVTTGGTDVGVVVITGGLLPGKLPGLIGVDVGVPERIGGTLAPPELLAIGPVDCGIEVGVPERIGGTLAPPGLLLELLDVVAGGVDVGSVVVVGVAVMTGGSLPPD